jgi:ABC-type uncharacterized transport system involved in gliding motility auxiliary subunit
MRKFITTSGLLLGLALFLAINIISNASLQSWRLDLTENSLYTLSKGSKNILTQLDEPITLRLYLSEKLITQLPGINTYALRVKELLTEYQRYAGNKLRLEFIDPEPFSEHEDRAVSYGLQGVAIDSSNTNLYFGLVGTNAIDSEEIITFFQPDRENFLEYDISKLIYKLANPKPPVMAIMSSLPIQAKLTNPLQPRQEPSLMIVEQLQQLFELRSLELDTQHIADDIDVLMLVHPKQLSPATLYAIDQFVLKGGRAIVFVDPYSEMEVPESDPQNPFAAANAARNSDLELLFAQWGIELETDTVVADMNLAQRVQMRRGNRTVVMDYPVYMNLASTDLFNSQDIVTADLDNINLATPGSLKAKPDATTVMSALLTTTEQAMRIQTNKLGMFADPEQLVRDFSPEQDFILAARITGMVDTAFPDGKPEESELTAPHLNRSQQEINVIVVADTDLLQDQFWVQVQDFLGQRLAIPLANNGNLVINSIESLMGNNDLINIRSRGNFSRPFTKVAELQRTAEQRFREKEQQLQTRLRETERKLVELQTQRQTSSGLLLSAEQRAELESFREQQVEIRRQLREVQHQLRKDIEALEGQMKFVNIGLMPLLIAFGGISLAYYRRNKMINKINGSKLS